MPAINQHVSIGQTADFAFSPVKAGNYFFKVKNSKGKIVASELLRVE